MNKTPETTLRRSTLDGAPWTPNQDREINDTVLAAFNAPAGVRLLHYLRAITINRVMGPEVSDCALRHHEGMRSLVAIIEARIAQGRAERAVNDTKTRNDG